MTEQQQHSIALVLVDLINPFDFPGGEQLADKTRAVIEPVRRLVARARECDVPVIYVNDNFGRWRSSFEEIVSRCEDGCGGDIARALHPESRDYFVLKPHRSGFYCTPLELLLRGFGTERMVLTGITTDMCILATANDARMRDLDVWIVRDGTAALEDEHHREALSLMNSSLDATVAQASDIDFGA